MAIQYADILACFDDPAIPAIALAPDIAAKAEKRAKRRIQRNGNREPTGNPPGRPKSSPEQAAESKELAGPHLSPPFLTKVGGGELIFCGPGSLRGDCSGHRGAERIAHGGRLARLFTISTQLDFGLSIRMTTGGPASPHTSKPGKFARGAELARECLSRRYSLGFKSRKIEGVATWCPEL
jgi:hypothetical protein